MSDETRDAADMLRRCSGLTKAGQRCNAPAMGVSPFCVSHDPDRVTDLAEWRKRGGHGKSNKARARKALPADLLTMAEVASYLGLALRSVLAGRTEPNVGTAAANIARALVSVAGAADLERRMDELERDLARFRRVS